jgi:hypothetical protein
MLSAMITSAAREPAQIPAISSINYADFDHGAAAG